MKFISTVIPLAALFSVASAIHVDHGSLYDNTDGVPLIVNCFNAPGRGNPIWGLSYFRDVPSFPNIGASDVVKLNGSGCGSCWEITYNGNSVKVVAVDRAGDGFLLALKTMDALTNNHGRDGVINANAKQLDSSSCGL